jgi:hypothetical protein
LPPLDVQVGRGSLALDGVRGDDIHPNAAVSEVELKGAEAIPQHLPGQGVVGVVERSRRRPIEQGTNTAGLHGMNNDDMTAGKDPDLAFERLGQQRIIESGEKDK